MATKSKKAAPKKAAPAKKKSTKKARYRSAVTGRAVTKDFAKTNPDTTVKESIKKKKN